MNKVLGYLRVMRYMMAIDLLVFKSIFFNKIIDRGIWVLTWVLIMGRIMPAQGISSSFGAFTLAGMIATIGIIETYSNTAALVADFEGDRVIGYYLTLPIPSWLVFVRVILYHALCFAGLAAFLLPFGNLFLGEHAIAYSSIAWGKFFLIFILINLSHGALVLWSASLVKSMLTVGHIWSRVLHPFWFFGGYLFSWQLVHSLFPRASYLLLLNPVMYATEGMRAALLGQEGFLNFWLCAGVVTLVTIAMSWNAIARLRRRLDFV